MIHGGAELDKLRARRGRVEVFKEESAAIIRELARNLFGGALERVVVDYTPGSAMGDLASPVAFELAKQLKRPPKALAAEMAAAFPKRPWLARVEAAGAGYLNLYLDRGEALRAVAREVRSGRPSREGPPIIVEHTNINPNKAAHIGHLRNAVLGDSLARMLRFLGHRVEVQNYIDDTGVQVADVLIGFRDILGWGLEQAQSIGEPIDRFCWDLYARVTEMYQKDPSRRSLQPAMLKTLEEGGGAVGALARWLTRRIVGCHLDTMRRIGVTYDFLPWESDILAGRFWEAAFRLLQDRHAIVRVETGERAGCWVMALEGERFADLKESEKIIVRSNGTVTYVGKDIAYQLWKFGLLPIDFRYEIFRRETDGHAVWSSTQGPGGGDHPSFGRAERDYNVIDVRQSYLQAIVAEGLRSLGYRDQADRSTHFAYEMVALTPRAASQLGVDLADEDRGRSYIGMSGRKGLGVKADDLLDAVEAQALREVQARHADLSPEEARRLAREIAVGAVRYFMIKFTRNKVLAFDFDEALSFEGETGPYLQYAVVRAAGIFGKMSASGGPDLDEARRLADAATFDLPQGPDAEEHWELLVQIARFQENVRQAVASLELSLLAKYSFSLAQRFNTFYHRYPVMKEPDPVWRRSRVILTGLFIAQMRRALDLMGIPVPARM
jgi:arginyl-tRNA synthetase